MQIRKTYQEVNPELLYAETRDLILKQGVSPGETKLETYTLPDQSADFISRSVLTFKVRDGGETGRECIRVHIVGSVRGETKLMMDVDETLFGADELAAFQRDLDFMFGSYEVKT